MRLGYRLPWRRGAAPLAVPERKGSAPLSLLTGDGLRRSGSRGYAPLSAEGFMANPVAHRAVRLIAEAAGSVPLLAYDDSGERPDHPARMLLARPNAAMAGPDLIETVTGHLVLAGNAFLELLIGDDGPAELYPLRPDRVSVIADADGWPRAYEYRAGGRPRRIAAAEGRLLHLKLFHPLDDRLGFAPLAAARDALDLSNAAARWNKALLDNSARPSGALVYQPKDGGNLTEDQYERLKGELEQGYAGPGRAGRPLLLEGGLDWKPMGLSPRDLDFAEARNGAARDIALACGVPPMLIGIPGDNTYANYQEANRAFWRLTVLPLLNRSAAALSPFLSAHYGGGLRIEADLDRAAGLAAERDALWARLSAADFLTEAEKRAAVGY